MVIGNRGRVEIDARKIMTKDVSVFGLALWGIPADEIRRAHEAIIAGLDSGALNPVVGTELPLKDAARAHQQVMEPGAQGQDRADSVISACASSSSMIGLKFSNGIAPITRAAVDVERRRRVHAHLFAELAAGARPPPAHLPESRH